MSLREIKSIPGLTNLYYDCSEDVQGYFEHLPELLKHKFPLDVCLAYAFSRLESGRRAALYCGVVRIHNVDARLAKTAVAGHIDYDRFIYLYEMVFKQQPPSAVKKELKTALEGAQRTRNEVLHGISKKAESDYQRRLRNAIACALHCAQAIDEHLRDLELKPFGDLRGFAPYQKLDSETSRFILLGMGFKLS